jgi:arginyl-tRNA synthetase
MTMKNFKRVIAENLTTQVGLPVEEIEAALTLPQHASHGDLSFPCFPLAKSLRKAPKAIAESLAAEWSGSEDVEKVEALNGYLNFFLKPDVFALALLSAVKSQGSQFGNGNTGTGKTVVIDYSSPNMGKELAFHHLRGTMIGNALSHLYKKTGWKVERVNHLGDWGTSYGKLIVMFEKEGLGEKDLPGLTLEKLNSLYRAFDAASKADPGLEDLARQTFSKLESGDTLYQKYWASFREVTLDELKRLYNLLSVEFDHYIGEAYFASQSEVVEGLLRDRSLLVQSQGALIVDLEARDLPPALIQKSDGASLYITRDLAAAIHRWKEYAFARCLYIVDNGQGLHFKQLFSVLEMLDCAWATGCAHIPFGLVLHKNEEGDWAKGKTRSGSASLLKDVLEAAQEKILTIMAEKSPMSGDRSDLAMQVAVGALVFSELKNRRLGDIRFEWDAALSFDGDSGPYVQNAHVRLCSILRKAKAAGSQACLPEEARLSLYTDLASRHLIQTLALFPNRVQAAVDADDPCPVAQFALQTADACHRFVHACRVLGSEEEKERLLLVECAKSVLGSALLCIGVPPIEEM